MCKVLCFHNFMLGSRVITSVCAKLIASANARFLVLISRVIAIASDIAQNLLTSIHCSKINGKSVITIIHPWYKTNLINIYNLI